ncbi:hypothetical protein SRHO_G00307470 [Serrasalmus rhombeus]
MAFGMRNAPATFQRLMSCVLQGLPNYTAYLDDVVVHSSTWDEHMEMLKAVFERLDQASLTLNLAKCDFGKATVLYLGQEVGQGRVRTPTDKVKAILDYPVPSTRRKLRRFLGMAGYYRAFCKNFSVIVLPLTYLLHANVEYRWSDNCQKAFEGLKSVLCSAPVLAAPNFSYPFKLDVDACDSGAGAVLLQEDSQGIDHPVELCPGLAAVGGAIPPEKVKGGVTQEAQERGVREQGALACLVQCRKADLLTVAEFYNVPVSRSARKAEIRDVLLATLREDGRLPVFPDSRSPTRAQSVGVEGADDAEGEMGVLSLAEAGGQTPRQSPGIDPVTTPPGPSSLTELDLNMAIRLKELDLAIKQQERETQLLRVRALELEASRPSSHRQSVTHSSEFDVYNTCKRCTAEKKQAKPGGLV